MLSSSPSSIRLRSLARSRSLIACCLPAAAAGPSPPIRPTLQPSQRQYPILGLNLLRLLAQKAEIGVVDGAEARVFVVGTAQTPAQAKNAALAGVLEEICAALGNLVPLLPDEPAKAASKLLCTRRMR